MLSEKVILTAPNGLHARPAGEMVAMIKTMDGKIRLTVGAKSVNGASMLSVLSLGMKSGTEVDVAAEGGDEAGNLRRVVEFIRNISE